MTTTISRLYNNYGDARAAVQQLETAGVAHKDISIIASNADNWYNDGKDTFPDRDLDGKDDRAQAAGKGASIGAAAGGAAGLLTGLGLMAIPGVGPVVAAGWLVTTLAGAAAGGCRARRSCLTSLAITRVRWRWRPRYRRADSISVESGRRRCLRAPRGYEFP